MSAKNLNLMSKNWLPNPRIFSVSLMHNSYDYYLNSVSYRQGTTLLFPASDYSDNV
jgi:hypothetical protein